MKNKNTPTEGQNSDIQTAESALRGAACCASFPVDCEGDLVEMTISKIKRSSGNIMSDPSELLEAVLFEAERLNPIRVLRYKSPAAPWILLAIVFLHGLAVVNEDMPIMADPLVKL
jgi:hypothetical protein